MVDYLTKVVQFGIYLQNQRWPAFVRSCKPRYGRLLTDNSAFLNISMRWLSLNWQFGLKRGFFDVITVCKHCKTEINGLEKLSGRCKSIESRSLTSSSTLRHVFTILDNVQHARLMQQRVDVYVGLRLLDQSGHFQLTRAIRYVTVQKGHFQTLLYLSRVVSFFVFHLGAA